MNDAQKAELVERLAFELFQALHLPTPGVVIRPESSLQEIWEHTRNKALYQNQARRVLELLGRAHEAHRQVNKWAAAEALEFLQREIGLSHEPGFTVTDAVEGDAGRKCMGGPNGTWCGKPAVYVCTEGKTVATGDWQGLQWFACPDHTEGQAKEPVGDFDARIARALKGGLVSELVCPVCHAPATRDRPDLSLMSATCTSCKWHFTPRTLIDDAVQALVGALVPMPAHERPELWANKSPFPEQLVYAVREMLIAIARLDANDAECMIAGILRDGPCHSDYEVNVRQVRNAANGLREWWELANGRELG